MKDKFEWLRQLVDVDGGDQTIKAMHNVLGLKTWMMCRNMQ